MSTVMPFGVRVFLGFVLARGEECDIVCRSVIGLVPGLRLLRLVRRMRKCSLLVKAFVISFEAMPILVFMYAIWFLMYAGLLFVAEPHSNIPTWSQGAWLAIVSTTTLGYGDRVPTTHVGRFITGVAVFGSLLYMAIPLGIIGNAFNDTWKDRGTILLIQRTKQCLQDAGLGPVDIPRLLKTFDLDGDGELDPAEFTCFIQGLKLPFNLEKINTLFLVFNPEGKEKIDSRDFVKALYPEAYHEIFGNGPRLSRREGFASARKFSKLISAEQHSPKEPGSPLFSPKSRQSAPSEGLASAEEVSMYSEKSETADKSVQSEEGSGHPSRNLSKELVYKLVQSEEGSGHATRIASKELVLNGQV